MLGGIGVPLLLETNDDALCSMARVNRLLLMALLSLRTFTQAGAWVAPALRAPLFRQQQKALMATSQLEQLASMTVLSVDTGDLDVIAEMAATGLISDATTNPLFVSRAGLSKRG